MPKDVLQCVHIHLFCFDLDDSRIVRFVTWNADFQMKLNNMQSRTGLIDMVPRSQTLSELNRRIEQMDESTARRG